MKPRIITKQEELAFRLTHKDFSGFTTKGAAKVMGLSVRRVNQLVASARKKCPQLFEEVSDNRELVKIVRYEGWMSDQVKEKF